MRDVPSNVNWLMSSDFAGNRLMGDWPATIGNSPGPGPSTIRSLEGPEKLGTTFDNSFSSASMLSMESTGPLIGPSNDQIGATSDDGSPIDDRANSSRCSSGKPLILSNATPLISPSIASKFPLPLKSSCHVSQTSGFGVASR